MVDKQVPAGVFYVYPTGSFHALDTREPMGPEFDQRWRINWKWFPWAGDAQAGQDGIHSDLEGAASDRFKEMTARFLFGDSATSADV